MNFPDEPIKPKNEQCGRTKYEWPSSPCTLDRYHEGDHMHVTFTGAILKRWR